MQSCDPVSTLGELGGPPWGHRVARSRRKRQLGLCQVSLGSCSEHKRKECTRTYARGVGRAQQPHQHSGFFRPGIDPNDAGNHGPQASGGICHGGNLGGPAHQKLLNEVYDQPVAGYNKFGYMSQRNYSNDQNQVHGSAYQSTHVAVAFTERLPSNEDKDLSKLQAILHRTRPAAGAVAPCKMIVIGATTTLTTKAGEEAPEHRQYAGRPAERWR